jgi:hypothetical protein
MRDEDRRGSSSNLISRDGRGPLSYGEKQALAQQAKNQRTSEGTRDEVLARQAAQPDTQMKAIAHSTGISKGTPADNSRR